MGEEKEGGRELVGEEKEGGRELVGEEKEGGRELVGVGGMRGEYGGREGAGGGR